MIVFCERRTCYNPGFILGTKLSDPESLIVTHFLKKPVNSVTAFVIYCSPNIIYEVGLFTLDVILTQLSFKHNRGKQHFTDYTYSFFQNTFTARNVAVVGKINIEADRVKFALLTHDWLNTDTVHIIQNCR
jgi:hypothetical protein